MCSSVVLVCLVAAAAAVQRASAADAGVAGRGGILHVPSAVELARARCPSACGDVVILYPFGIGAGCFRQGFELICDKDTTSPRLFLGNSTIQIDDLYPGQNEIFARAVHINGTMKPGMDTYNMSWEVPMEGLTIYGYNNLYVVGCGVDVYMFGRDTNDPIGFCTSICLDDKKAMKKVNNAAARHYRGDIGIGMGSCSINLGQDVPAFGFKVGRLDGGVSALSGEVLSNVKVFLAEDYRFDISDIYSSQINESHVKEGVMFNIAITDQPSCESAKKNKATYACNTKSDCQDLPTGGYTCECPSNDDVDVDNPYVINACSQGLRLFSSLLVKCHA
jgi:hypothetical protein